MSKSRIRPWATLRSFSFDTDARLVEGLRYPGAVVRFQLELRTGLERLHVLEPGGAEELVQRLLTPVLDLCVELTREPAPDPVPAEIGLVLFPVASYSSALLS